MKIFFLISAFITQTALFAQKEISYNTNTDTTKRVKQKYWYFNFSFGGVRHFIPLKYSSNSDNIFEGLSEFNIDRGGSYLSLFDVGKVIGKHQIGLRVENLYQTTGYAVIDAERGLEHAIISSLNYTYFSANYYYRVFEKKVFYFGAGGQLGFGYNVNNIYPTVGVIEYTDQNTGATIYFEEHRNILSHHKVIINFGPQVRFGFKLFKKMDIFFDSKLMYTPYSPRVYRMNYIYTNSLEPALNTEGTTDISTDIINWNYGVGIQFNFRKK